MNIASKNSVSETLDKFVAELGARNIGVIAQIDHSNNATSVGMELRPTQLILFGNPMLGSPLIIASQEAGIELPMKALAWEDADGQVWLKTTNPSQIAESFRLEGLDPVIEKMTGALEAMTAAAVA